MPLHNTQGVIINNAMCKNDVIKWIKIPLMTSVRMNRVKFVLRKIP